MSDFPVIDLRYRPSLNENQELMEAVVKATSESGFLLLTNHGIEQRLVDRCFSLSLEFFQLPNEAKLKYSINRFAGSNPINKDVAMVHYADFLEKKVQSFGGYSRKAR